MECNKEEAIRAKSIAVTKMENKDFQAARRFALKAQQLFKDLENVSQIVMVCDVHCSAEKKIIGNEIDWYGVLQIEETADETTIKRQYKKFALQLHPDKNKFPGAAAAFQLIGQAQGVLLDKGKRALHDNKRKSSASRSAPPYRPAQGTNLPNFGFQSNFSGVNSQHQQQQRPTGQQGFSNGRSTFWTACPYCHMKYQYLIQAINKSLVCQKCSKPFVGYERSGQGAPKPTNSNQGVFPQRKDAQMQGASRMQPGHAGNFAAEHLKKEFPDQKGSSSQFDSEKRHGKRQRKRNAESSESFETDSSTDNEEAVLVDEDGDFNAKVHVGSLGEYPRRSSRCKGQVSYKENLSDGEDTASHPKKARRSEFSIPSEEVNGNRLNEDASKMNEQSGVAAGMKDQNEVKHEENGVDETNNLKGTGKQNGCNKHSEVHVDPAAGSTTESTSDPEVYSCPDPEFHDFDADRNEECFSVGQIWAAYDDQDAMPRFYALIRKVFSPGFKLRITWLEADPDDEKEIEWVTEGLPACCGKFKHGQTDNTEDRLMFSHLVSWEKGSGRGAYKILPRKGEIWALFKNWDINWKSVAETDRKFDYDFVEILSDFTKDVGVTVAYLGKVKGFVSLFCRINKDGKDRYQIPRGELFRFSHMIPSFKLTGEERQGVPKGSFELDPACLPKNIDEISFLEDLKPGVHNCQYDASCSRSSYKLKSEVVHEDVSSMHQDGTTRANTIPEDDNIPDIGVTSPALSLESMEVPDPEFFNFDAERSIQKFNVGQIWALYSDEDGLPKYYGRIVKLENSRRFEVRLKWLESCGLPEGNTECNDTEKLICCGRFKLLRKVQSYTSTASFSHQVTAVEADKKNEYSIMPRKGEVWALYRNSSGGIEQSDLRKFEYDVAEVLEENDSQTKVAILERVDGFNSVFKARVRGGSTITMEVPHVDLLRFSHQILAFRLTDERGGSLRGSWELDPAALPVYYFTRK